MLKVSALLALSLLAGGCQTSTPPGGAAPITSARPGEAAGVRFVEVLTGGASASEALPIIVVIHGLSGHPEAILRRTGLTSLPVRARLIAPYGPDVYENGFSWFSDWTHDGPFAESTRRLADSLAAMIEEIARLRPTTGKAIVTGFSQGGILSFTLAVLHPEAVRAAFPLSGNLASPLVPSTWPAGKEKPHIHAFHGTSDHIVSVDGARTAVKRLADLGLPAELTEYPGEGHTISDTGRRALAEAITRELRP